MITKLLREINSLTCLLSFISSLRSMQQIIFGSLFLFKVSFITLTWSFGVKGFRQLEDQRVKVIIHSTWLGWWAETLDKLTGTLLATFPFLQFLAYFLMFLLFEFSRLFCSLASDKFLLMRFIGHMVNSSMLARVGIEVPSDITEQLWQYYA